jgi:hypothetical protein
MIKMFHYTVRLSGCRYGYLITAAAIGDSTAALHMEADVRNMRLPYLQASNQPRPQVNCNSRRSRRQHHRAALARLPIHCDHCYMAVIPEPAATATVSATDAAAAGTSGAKRVTTALSPPLLPLLPMHAVAGFAPRHVPWRMPAAALVARHARQQLTALSPCHAASNRRAQWCTAAAATAADSRPPQRRHRRCS